MWKFLIATQKIFVYHWAMNRAVLRLHHQVLETYDRARIIRKPDSG
jgi:hypothetical protein